MGGARRDPLTPGTASKPPRTTGPKPPTPMAKPFSLALLAAGALFIAGCEVDTGSETDADGSRDRTLEISVDEEIIDDARDNVNAAGEAIREGASEAGEAIRDGAERVDDNVDVELGEDARDGDG